MKQLLLTILLQQALIIHSIAAQTLVTADIHEGRPPLAKSSNYTRPTYEDYLRERQNFIDAENQRFLGANLCLSENEQIVNKYLMKLKEEELKQGFNNSYNFVPARHFFEMLDQVKQSKLFQFIQRLPKGGVLHAHDTAIGSTQLIVNATYEEYLWQKGDFEDENGPQFKFSEELPGGGWEKVSDIRRATGEEIYNEKVRSFFSLYTPDPLNAYKVFDKIWDKFQAMFFALEPLITYEPVWRKYYSQALQEFYDDKVYYLEFRGVLPGVYKLNGTVLSPKEVVQIYYEETEKFKATHSKFLGVKFIYAPIRFANDTVAHTFFKTARELHEAFPNFVAGFDLVGQEDTGRPLIQFAEELLRMPESIQFYFHAGETNWYGMKTDENMVDAVLLGTKRIGHGYAMLKHPNLLKEIKRRQICVEINPISNQVLKLVQDYRNHPAALFFSDAYPVVVSSDDPSFWRATPLSHDFYIAFLGIASAHHDLRLLKKLALNSIDFSAMNVTEKIAAKHKWKSCWHEEMDKLAIDIVSANITFT